MAAFGLASLVAAVLDSLDDDAPAVAVKEVLHEALRHQDELVDALGSTFDRRTSNVLHRSDRATITHFLLPPHYRTGPHEHRMWVVTAMCSGTETNTFYRRHGDVLERITGRRIAPGELLVLGVDAIHDVEAGAEPVSSIHVYGGDLGSMVRSSWDPTSLSERRYDVASEVARLTAALAAANLLAHT
jgi:predicted metal-dependent enzyme (double-stranded beta helix superfamily)